jgi:hypothetical protein
MAIKTPPGRPHRLPFTKEITAGVAADPEISGLATTVSVVLSESFWLWANATSPSGPQSISSSGAIGTDPRQYIMNLTGVPNAQYITVHLANVNDSAGNSSSAVSASMGVLVGDVNASGVVTTGDTNLCKAQALQSVTAPPISVTILMLVAVSRPETST